MTDIVYIDKRNRSEEQDYSVAFAARDGEWGHAFAIFHWGDEVSRSSRFEGMGFYPGDAESNLKVAFGSDGALDNDTWAVADTVLSVQINKPSFDAARGVRNEWKRPESYFLGINDCTTFVAELAEIIGLRTPARILAPYPIQYVSSLIEINTTPE